MSIVKPGACAGRGKARSVTVVYHRGKNIERRADP
jgi:hypothetical protein